jgi:hypothetical protein
VELEDWPDAAWTAVTARLGLAAMNAKQIYEIRIEVT